MAYTEAMNYQAPQLEQSHDAEIEAAVRDHAQIDYGRITSGAALTPEDQAILDDWIESVSIPINGYSEL